MAVSKFASGSRMFAADRNTSNTTTGVARGLYDVATGCVRINFYATHTANIGTNSPMFNVPSQYRPSSTVAGSCVAFNSAGAPTVGRCKIDSTGNLYQIEVATTRQVYGYIEYRL